MVSKSWAERLWDRYIGGRRDRGALEPQSFPLSILRLEERRVLNVAPVLTGAVANQAVTDTATIQPFEDASIVDPDVGDVISVRIDLSNTANGQFQSLGGFVAVAGHYEFVGTAAAATTALQGLVFNPTDNQVAPGSSVTTIFTVSMNDGAVTNVNSTASVVATNPNGLPTITGAAAGQTVNDTSTETPFSNVTIGDPDSAVQTMTVTVSLDDAAKGSFTAGSLGGFVHDGNGSYTRTGTAAAVTTAIRGLVFNPADNRVAPGQTETTTFTISVSDGVVATPITNSTTTVVSTSINQGPSITGVTNTAQPVNDTDSISPFANVTIADPDSPHQTVNVRVTLDNNAKGSFTTLAGFTYDNVNDRYTFTGTAAAATTAIRGLVFSPTENRVAIGQTETTDFTIRVSDGVATAVVNSNTSVVSTSMNDAPTITGTTPTPFAVNDNATVSPFAAVTIGNDAGNVTVDVALDTAAKGVLSGGSFVHQGNGVYRFSGTAAAATTAIRALVFNPANDRVAVGQTETTTFTITVTDAQAASTINSDIKVAAASVNDAPSITGTVAGQTVNDSATVQPFTTTVISDTDNPAQTVTVVVRLDTAAKGAFTGLAGFTNNGDGSYTFVGTSAAATTAIQGLVFTPAANRVAPGSTETTTFTIDVEDSSGADATNSVTTVVSTSVNNAPTISGTVNVAQPVLDTGTISPFATVTIGDIDNPSQTLTVIVSLDAAAKGSFTTLGGFVDNGNGSYTFTGTAAAATTAIRALVFTPTENRVAPTLTETTTFTISANDNVAAAVLNTNVSVVTTAVNQTPAINGASNVAIAINDNQTTSPFAGVSITNPDAENVTVRIQLDFPARGALSAGFTHLGNGLYEFVGTAAAATTALQALVFTPTANTLAVGGTETTTFTISVSDAAGPTVTNNVTKVTVTSVNDAPTITGAQANQAVNDNATISPFANVTIGDVDNPAQNVTVTVSLDQGIKGRFTTLAGFVDNMNGTYTFTGTAAAATTAIRGLVFTPAPNRVTPGTTETTTFTIGVSDGIATLVTNNTTTVVSTSINDAPFINGTVNVPQPIGDDSNVDPFSTVMIGDPDRPNQVLTVVVKIDNAAKGHFVNLGGPGGFVNAPNGTYTITGTGMQVTNAIRGLRFLPNPNRVPPGQTETTNFSISVSDGVAAAVVNNNVSVISSSINDPPDLTGVTTTPINITDKQTTKPFENVTIVENDDENVHVRIELDSGAKGTLTGGFTFQGNGVYTFDGTAAAATAAIQALVFDPTENSVAVGGTVTTTFRITLTDTNSPPLVNNQTSVIATSVNDPAVISGTGTVNVNDNATVNPLANIVITDADRPNQTVTVTVTLDDPAKGDFTAASRAGFTVVPGGYQITGSAATVQAALRNLVFQPVQNRVLVGLTETTTITVAVNDGFVTVADDNSKVVSLSVNDPPSISGVTVGVQPTNDNASVTPFQNVTVSDPDGLLQTVRVTITLSDPALGAFDNLGGFVHQGNGVYVFNGLAADANVAIRALVFVPVNNRVAPGTVDLETFTITVNDLFLGVVIPGSEASDSTTQVQITSVNDLPTIVGIDDTQAVDDNEVLNDIFSTITITDVDSPAQPIDVYIFVNDANMGLLSSSLVNVQLANYGAYYVLTADSAATATAHLRSLVFTPTENRATPGATEVMQFDIYVGESYGFTDGDLINVTITSINDAPVLQNPSDGFPLIVWFTDEDTPAVFTVAEFLSYNSPGNPSWAAQMFDADVGQTAGIAVTGTQGVGAWEYSVDNGNTFLSLSGASAAQARLLPADALLRYTPDGKNGEIGKLSFAAWDGFTGVAGAAVNSAHSGDASAFSQAKLDGDLYVFDVNDAPTLDPNSTRLPSLPTTDFAGRMLTVADLLELNGQSLIDDVDNVSATGIAVTGVSQTGGQWYFSVDGGFSWGSLSFASDASALLLRPTDKVLFVPNGVNAELATLTFRAWDQSSGFAGSYINALFSGGSAPVSSGQNSLTVGVWALHVTPPLINGIGQTDMEVVIDYPASEPFKVEILWGDSQTAEVVGNPVGPGIAQYRHTYFGNPDRNNGAAPIPIRVTATNLLDNTSITRDVLATVPGQGLSTPQLEQSREGFVVRLNETPEVEVATFVSSTQPSVSQPLVVSSVVTDDAAEEEIRRVYLRIVGPTLEEGDTIALPGSILNDLAGFLKNLPDGRYRVYLEEAGATRMVIDVTMRHGKPTDPSAGAESTQDRPPNSEEESPPSDIPPGDDQSRNPQAETTTSPNGGQPAQPALRAQPAPMAPSTPAPAAGTELDLRPARTNPAAGQPLSIMPDRNGRPASAVASSDAHGKSDTPSSISDEELSDRNAALLASLGLGSVMVGLAASRSEKPAVGLDAHKRGEKLASPAKNSDQNNPDHNSATVAQRLSKSRRLMRLAGLA